MAPHETQQEALVLESLPEDVIATIQVRDEWFARLPRSSTGLEFLVADLQRWRPGTVVRVAFLGGDTALLRDIEGATQEITNACNLELDFGFDDSAGTYRTWAESDKTYSAEIRVSFDQGGYFSLVGTDSIDPNVGHPLGAVGGRPGQRSLNLGGFTTRRPQTWQGTVRHEFLHALAFHHAHQNMRGPCEFAFRWEDDEGYEPTRSPDGVFLPDGGGRRPGIYTYLAGAPNHWSRAKVDHNLRRIDDPKIVPGPFDRASIMLYRFPESFYRNPPSDCAPIGAGISLSEEDKRGLRLLYPAAGPKLDEAEDRRNQLIEVLEAPAVTEAPGLETGGWTPSSEFARQASETLRRVMSKD